jgi:spermidine synthase
MPFWYDEKYDDDTRFGLLTEKRLVETKSDFQKIEVLETKAFGRVLVLDGIFMTSERDEHFYHEMIVHPALTTVAQAERVLVIGGGDGGTVREVLRHDQVKQVVMVEIDAALIEICQRFLPAIGTAWEDPRLQVLNTDGVAYVSERAPDQFDVILLDGCDPVGPAKELFGEEFYRGCQKLLSEHGAFVVQSGSPFDQRDLFLAVVRRLQETFTHAHPYLGPVPLYSAGYWSWTFATQSADPLAIDEQRAANVEENCKYYNREIHRGAFALPSDLRRALASSGQ